MNVHSFRAQNDVSTVQFGYLELLNIWMGTLLGFAEFTVLKWVTSLFWASDRQKNILNANKINLDIQYCANFFLPKRNAFKAVLYNSHCSHRLQQVHVSLH